MASLTEQFPVADTLFVGIDALRTLRVGAAQERIFTTDIAKNNTVLAVLSRAHDSNVGGVMHLSAMGLEQAADEKTARGWARQTFDMFRDSLLRETGAGRHYECILFGPRNAEIGSAPFVLFDTISKAVASTAQFDRARLVEVDAHPFEVVVDVKRGTLAEREIDSATVMGFMQRNPDTYMGANALFPGMALGS